MVAVGAATLVALPGAAQAGAAIPDGPSPGRGAPGAVQAEPSVQDKAFLHAANEINLAGIVQGRIAWTRAGNGEVKKFAARLLVDHIKLNAEIAEAAHTLRIRLGATPSAGQQAVAVRYETAPAGSFDALYLSTQLELQREAKRIADVQIAEGGDPSITRIAAGSVPILSDHQKILKEAAIRLDS